MRWAASLVGVVLEGCGTGVGGLQERDGSGMGAVGARTRAGTVSTEWVRRFVCVIIRELCGVKGGCVCTVSGECAAQQVRYSKQVPSKSVGPASHAATVASPCCSAAAQR